MGEDWNVWRDLIAPLTIITLACVIAYLMGGVDVFNP